MTVNGNAHVGVIDDHAHMENVTPRRPAAWLMVAGSSPPLASAFKPRTDIEDKITGTLRPVLCGGGDMGKSQLAVRAYTSSSADVQVWVAGVGRVVVTLNGTKFVAGDGQQHYIDLVAPGSSVSCQAGAITVGAKTTTDSKITLRLITPGALSINGPKTINASGDVGCVKASGMVTVHNE
ncbi:hypothetical protein E3N85_12490 [Cryobacterium sp. Hz9]|nr:hypothetical protein E3N85_12490 [Cryobacterium sp. Hz9]